MRILTKENFDKLLEENAIYAYKNEGKVDYEGVYCTKCELLTNTNIDKTVYVLI